MKKIAILGSTGSIGVQTLQVIDELKGDFQVVSLVAYSNAKLLNEQYTKYNPHCVGVIDKTADISCLSCKNIFVGQQCLIDCIKGADIVVVATIGIASLKAVEYAITHNIDVALANKEVLVAAGQLIVELLKTSKSKLLPIDSEHSAIWQCLQGGQNPLKLILTASGGPFVNYTFEQLQSVTVEQALKHPKWNMGKKISIDSATMVNKGLEVIEASWLFDIKNCDIEVVTHPQSVVHSMVEYADGSVIAQLGNPDMRLPIQYALTYPNRINSQVKRLNICQVGNLQFLQTADTLGAIKLARQCLDKGGLSCAIYSAADDVAVELFIDKKIGFTQITQVINQTLSSYSQECNILTIDNIIKTYDDVKNYVRTTYGGVQ